jgi:hypothetical protein
LIMRIFKKNHINFSANVANLGDNIFWFCKFNSEIYRLCNWLWFRNISPIEIKHTWSREF